MMMGHNRFIAMQRELYVYNNPILYLTSQFLCTAIPFCKFYNIIFNQYRGNEIRNGKNADIKHIMMRIKLKRVTTLKG